MDSIRSLIERIEVSPGEKRGNPNVVLFGALASLLDFALPEKPPPPPESPMTGVGS